jgi:hypothetical protein
MNTSSNKNDDGDDSCEMSTRLGQRLLEHGVSLLKGMGGQPGFAGTQCRADGGN